MNSILDNNKGVFCHKDVAEEPTHIYQNNRSLTQGQAAVFINDLLCRVKKAEATIAKLLLEQEDKPHFEERGIEGRRNY